jgi:hypothetical protein
VRTEADDIPIAAYARITAELGIEAAPQIIVTSIPDDSKT